MSEDRVALVTGAGRGIGAATSRLLADRGLRVVGVDSCAGTDPERSGVPYALASADDLARLDDDLGERGTTVRADVRDPEALEAASSLAVERYGRLDVTVAAAAVIAGGAPQWESRSRDHLDLLWSVDVAGVWNTAAATVPRMLAGPDPSGCRFVAVASAAGSRGMFGLSAYVAAKHAVVGIVRGLAADLVGTGVCACAVSPGATGTAMLQATADLYDVPVAELSESQLIRRPLTPDEVAATIAFCCSREGAAVNGSVVAADGGTTS